MICDGRQAEKDFLILGPVCVRTVDTYAYTVAHATVILLKEGILDPSCREYQAEDLIKNHRHDHIVRNCFRNIVEIRYLRNV